VAVTGATLKLSAAGWVADYGTYILGFFFWHENGQDFHFKNSGK
jgi:hypothetical protein